MKQSSIRNVLELEDIRGLTNSIKDYPLSFIIQQYELVQLYEYWRFSQSFKQMWTYRNTHNLDAFQVGAQLMLTEFENDRFLLKSDNSIKWLMKAGFIEIHGAILQHLLKDDLHGFITFFHPELNLVIRVVERDTLANILFAKKVVSTTQEHDVRRRRSTFIAVIVELLKEQTEQQKDRDSKIDN